MMPVRERHGALVRGLAVLVLCVSLLGCSGLRWTRWDAEGRYEDVVAEASRARTRPRGQAARAYARALVRLDRTEQARDVLQSDFRHGGDPVSLLALADLEYALGRIGIAALHYERVIELGRKHVRGRADVCAVLERRVRALVDAGEGLAAEHSLEVRANACPAIAGEEGLYGRIDAAARREVDARIDGTRCPLPGCVEARTADRIAAIERALAEAAEAGPAELRAVARRHRAEVDAEGVAAILLAELHAPVGQALLGDDELVRLIGSKRWGDLAPVVASKGEAEAAYLQLRLAEVVRDLPVTPSPLRAAGQREQWFTYALEGSGASAWRLLAWRGDLTSVELELSSRYRPRATDVIDVDAHAPEHWSARVPYDDESTPAMLAVARLRWAAGRRDLALELARHRLALAEAHGDPRAAAWAGDEAKRHLAWGRPWQALAIAEAVTSDELAPLREATASAIALQGAVCGGPCPGDDDRDLVARVLGDAWVQSRSEAIASLDGAALPSPDDRCPSLGELLEPDARGPLAEALAAARTDLRAPGRAEQLVAAIEAEPAMVCAARFVIPLLAFGQHALAAGRLGDAIALATPPEAGRERVTEADLSIVSGDWMRAETLMRVATAEVDAPMQQWLAFARRAHAVESRDLELVALREALLHDPGLGHRGIRLALVEQALHDRFRAWAEANTEVGREAVMRHVDDELARLAPAQRWAEREALAAHVLAARWVRPEHGSVLVEILVPDAEAHPRAAARLRGEEASGLRARSPWDEEGLAWEVRHAGRHEVPIATQVFADPTDVEGLRLALATHARDWSVRRRIAAGLAAYGTALARVHAVSELRSMADPAGRSRIDALLLAGATAVPANEGEAPSRTRTHVVGDPEWLLHLVFDLDLEPTLVAR